MSNKQGVQNKRRGSEIFVKSNKRGKPKQKGSGGGGGWDFKESANIGEE